MTIGPDRIDTSNLFPLAEFLTSLSDLGIRGTLDDYRRIDLALRAGGPWTVSQFREVLSSLLVRDREQGVEFRRRFNDFFSLPGQDQARFSGVDLERALPELRGLTPEPRLRAIRLPDLWKPPERKRAAPRRWRRWSSLAALVLAGALGLQEGRPPVPEDAPVAQQARVQDVPNPATRTYPHAPVLVLKEVLPTERPPAWPDLRLLGIAALAYGWWLWKWLAATRGGPDPGKIDDSRPRLFRPESIGGAPAPRLDRQTLDRLADSLGYFRSEETGQDLDVPASVEMTVRNGGIPTPVFELRKRVRSLLVLEDLQAEARAWNPIARELALGLDRRGISVVYGTFAGIPDRFRTADGLDRRIEDLEDERHGYLVLIFSDGKGLRPAEVTFVLERLARWPQVAWMQLQERRGWDWIAARPAVHGLSVFPADREGLLSALATFTTERAPLKAPRDPESWRGLPPLPVQGSLEEHVKGILRDSLLWAQGCAMAQPPIGLGLADRLRERFHPWLPPERVERLLALPGSRLITGGLRFGDPVLAVLREGFVTGRGEAEQEAVLGFLLEQTRLAEPDDPESLAHQAWEWRLERTRLELEPEPAVKRLAVLSRGPLGESIRADLARVQGSGPGPRRLPLRAQPGPQAADQLAAIVEGREVYRPGLWPEAGLAIAAVALLALSLWRIGSSDPEQFGMQVQWSGLKVNQSAAVRIERREGARWRRVMGTENGGVSLISDSESSEYRAVALIDGLTAPPLLLGGTSGTFEIELKVEAREIPCREEHPEIGLVVDRCASPLIHSGTHSPPSERRWPARIGIEIGNRITGIGTADSLLALSEVDVVYRLDPGLGQSDRTMNWIRDAWGSWGDRVHVRSWTVSEVSTETFWLVHASDEVSLDRWSPPTRSQLQFAWSRGIGPTPTIQESPGRDGAASMVASEADGLARNPDTSSPVQSTAESVRSLEEEVIRDLESAPAGDRRSELNPTVPGPSPCPDPQLTLCGNACVDLNTHPFHSGSCFQIALSLTRTAAEGVDEPPAWTDEGIQPRRYYRLFYAWNESKTAVVVRSLPARSRWDRGEAPGSVELTLSAEAVVRPGYTLAVTDLEVHCSGPARVAGFNGTSRKMYEKLSTQSTWRPFGGQPWRGPAEMSIHSGLARTLGPALTPWEELCARQR
ncbi:MAG TPA: hypothetical protein VN493_12450 [Thermoanaerobaculia bacterium]|nr:hypothetical protein [Thermoanaerobaculia bacterium]